MGYLLRSLDQTPLPTRRRRPKPVEGNFHANFRTIITSSSVTSTSPASSSLSQRIHLNPCSPSIESLTATPPSLVFPAVSSLSTNANQHLLDVSIKRLEVCCIYLISSMFYPAPQYWPLAMSH